MNIKTFTAGVALMLLLIPAAQTQAATPDGAWSARQNQDTLQTLNDELSALHSQIDAQERERQLERVWRRKKYMKVGLADPTLERTDGEEMTWKTDFSAFFQSGRTSYFHSKPIAGMIKIGFDYGVSMNYAKLKLKTAGGGMTSQPGAGNGQGSNMDGFDEIVSQDPSNSPLAMAGINLGMHKFEADLHIGPSVSINPWNHLIATAYFHVMPTGAGILENDNFSYGFGCAFSAGVSVSYKVISVGVEGLWSTIKYKQASFDDDDEDDYSDSEESGLFATKDFKLKQKGPRFYVAFRF